MRDLEYLQMCGDLEREKWKWDRDNFVVGYARKEYEFIARMEELGVELTYELEEEAAEKKNNVWRGLPNYTELYYDLYYSITAKEAEDILFNFGYDNNKDCMLVALIRELKKKEDQMRYLPSPAPEKDSEIMDEDGWEDAGWRTNIWRGLPGYPELYYDLYNSMSLEEVSDLIENYLCSPMNIDPNMIFMLETIEKELK